MRRRKDPAVPPSRRPVPRRKEFSHWTTDTVRFGDLDRQNHVNNAVYSTYFETGRVLVLRDPDLRLIVPDCQYALVRAEIDFIAEMHWPGTAEIGTAFVGVGTSSLTLRQVVFVGEQCSATAVNTLVLIDGGTRRPRPFPPDVAARIRAAVAASTHAQGPK
jgi:acyl-CoA thioester hydrolase